MGQNDRNKKKEGEKTMKKWGKWKWVVIVVKLQKYGVGDGSGSGGIAIYKHVVSKNGVGTRDLVHD